MTPATSLPTNDLDIEIAAERAFLAEARRALARMRERAQQLYRTGDTVAGDAFSSESLGRNLSRRVAELVDDPTTPLFFGRLAGLYAEGKPYALLALSGSVIWLFFANSVTLAANSLVGSAPLITKVYFPRLLVPVAPVIAALVDFALAFCVLVVVALAYQYVPGGGEHYLFIVPFVGLAARS